MSFVYNNEVIDLLLKKSLGSAYTSSALVPGQENQILPKILNQQLFASPITNKTASNFTWSASSNVAGGGTVKSLSNVAGETEPTSFTYIKKYENIPMTVVAGTNYRAWKPTNSNMISKLENTIIGKSSFPFTLTTNINNYNTIYNTNSSFKPVISNGVLLFLGNIAPDSNSTVSFSEVHIYEGEFGAKSELELNELTNVNVPTPSNGELLQWDAANSQWISGPAAASAIADANIEALNNVNVSHATTNQDDSLIYDKANSQWVAGTPVTTLAGLSDTTITTPSANQSLVYNATNTKWENANLTTTNITDINLTSVANGQALVYDSATSKFVNGLPNLNINNVSDVNITSPADKNVLIYDTATQKWINGLPVLNVNDINDVNTSGLIDGQVLVYNNNTQKWVPGSAAASSVTGVYLRDLQDVDMTNIAQVVPDWTQSHKLAATTGQNGEYLGKSVSTIGTWTAVGAPNYQDTANLLSNVGRVFLFKAGTETQTISSPQNREGSFFGQSVFLTSTFLAVGSIGYDDLTNSVINTGAVLIYNYNSGTELYATSPNQTLLGTANSYLGYSIDTNGTWMISGAPENITGTNNALKGKAYIYKLDTTWSQKKILTADDGSNEDKFGTAVAINNDYAFVGCETKNSYAGGVYIYKRTSDTVWDALHIVRSKTLAAGDYFGQSISVGGDFLMVGCPKGEYAGTANSTKAGEVFVYKKQSNGNWGDLSGNISVTGHVYTDITVSGTSIGPRMEYMASGIVGNELFVAYGSNSPNAINNNDRVWKFNLINYTWTNITPTNGISDVNASMNGAIYNSKLYVWGTNGTVASMQYFDISTTPATLHGITNQGTWPHYSVGKSILYGSKFILVNNSVTGASCEIEVHSFELNSTEATYHTWTKLANHDNNMTGKLTDNASFVIYNNKGYLFGGTHYGVGYSNQIWEFDFSNNTWSLVTVTGTAPAGRVGHTANVYDNKMFIIGGSNSAGDGGGTDNNDAWSFDFSNNTWTELFPHDSNLQKVWRHIAHVYNDNIIIFGGRLNDNTQTNAVRTFGLIPLDPTAGYYENSKLTASDSTVNDHFGCSVDITTQFGVIGARTQGSSYTKAGAAYMISNTNEGYWDHSKKITASDLAIGDEFGISVSIFDRYASVGAWKEQDTGEVDQGSAYLFNLGSPGTNDQFTLIYNSDTGRWSIGKVTASGGSGSGLDSIIGTQAMINANTPNGAQLFWDATNQTWSTNTSNFLPTGDPDQSTPAAGPTWTTSWNGGDNQLAFNSHLVPTSDNSFDIGSPGNKIRDLYVSENSLWIGDTHKITIEGGTMKFRKRDVSKVPASIAAAGGTSAGALASAGVSNLSSMKLHHWETYAKTLNMAGGVGNARISDVFANNDTDYADSDNISDKANTNNPTFTGTVTLGQAPTGDLHAATKKYVDDTAGSIDTSTLAPKANPVFTGFAARFESTSNNTQLQIKATHSGVTQQYNIFSAVTANGNGRGLHFQNHDTSAVQMSIRSDGKVGIGTTSPSGLFDIEGNISSNGLRTHAKNLNTGTGSYVEKLFFGGDNELRIGVSADNYNDSNWDNAWLYSVHKDLKLTTSQNMFFCAGGHSSERMRITSSGNVGIGTTSPSQKLEVNGTVKATAFQGDGSALTGVITANSPTFTGTPTAPTAAAGTNDNQIATTAFVTTATSNPTFTGNIDVAGSGSFRGNSAINNSTVAGVHLGKYTHPNGTDNYGNIQIVSNNDNGGWIDWIKTSGDTDYRGRIRYGTGDQYEGMRFYTEPYSTDTNEKMIITTGGNVGIGTSSPESMLHLKSTGDVILRLEADTNNSGEQDNPMIFMSQDGWPSNHQYFKIGMNGDAGTAMTGALTNAAYLTAYQYLQFGLGLPGSEEAIMTIHQDKNVGIGTTSPKEKLHVIGSLMIAGSEAGNETGEEGIKIIPYHYTATSATGNAGGRIFFKEDSSDNYGFSIGFNGGADNNILNWRGNNFAINRHNNNSTGSTVFSVKRETGNVILAEDGGKVGIGTTNPLGNLHINSGTTRGGELLLSRENPTSTDMRAGAIWLDTFSEAGWGTERMCFAVNAENGSDIGNPLNKTPQMVLKSNGNVGIGTTSPSQKLEVKTGTNYDGISLNNEDGGLLFRAARGTSKAKAYMALYDADINSPQGIVAFHNDGDLPSYINTGGNVGIGTTSPSQKLEVNGTVKATAFQGDGSALTGVAKQSDIDTAINGLIDSAPGTLNTLNELAASIGDASNFAGTVSNFADVDTVTTAPTDGQALVWDNANSKWKPGSVAAASGGGGGGSSGGGFNWTAQDGTKNISDINQYTGYTITASSSYSSTYNAVAAFSQVKLDTDNIWISAGNKYTNGSYTGSETTNGYNGEWLQINFGKKVKVYSYSITSQHMNNHHNRAPGGYKMFGSNDGSSWTEVHTGSASLSDYSGSYNKIKENTLSSPSTYQYFRLVINSTTGTDSLKTTSIVYLAFYGAFPEQVDKVAVVSGTNMSFVNYKDTTSISLVKGQFYELSMLRLSITPTAVDSVIKLEYNLHIYITTEAAWDIAYIVTRTVNGVETTFSKDPTNNKYYSGFIGNNYQNGSLSFQYIDEPGTTQEVIYKIKFTSTGSNHTMQLNRVHPTEEAIDYRETGVSSASAIEHPKPQQSLTTVTNASQVEGQVLETLEGLCDGRSITVSSGTYTLPTAAFQTWSNTDHAMKDVDASIINYKPPPGTKQVIYEFRFIIWYNEGTSGFQNGAYDFYIDGNKLGHTLVFQKGTWESNFDTVKLIVDIGENDYANNKILDWNSSKEIKIQMAEASNGSKGFVMHKGRYNNDDYFSAHLPATELLDHPTIKITAIGTADYDVVQRVVTYKDGQILETLQGPCDGSTITVNSGIYTMPGPTSIADNTVIGYTTHIKEPLSEITYKAPSGAERIVYEFTGNYHYEDTGGMIFAKFYVDDTAFSTATTDAKIRDGIQQAGQWVFPKMIIKSSQYDLSVPHKFHWMIRSVTSSQEVKYGDPDIVDGSIQYIKITAIGRQVAPASAADFKIQKVDTISTLPNNGNMLTWDKAKGRWKPSEFIVSNDDGTKNISDLDLYHGYQITASNYHSWYIPENAFRGDHGYDGATVHAAWYTESTKYNATSGAQLGNVDTSGYKGEWIQINFGKKVKVYHFGIRGLERNQAVWNNTAPGKYKLFGSNDGSTWTDVHTGSAVASDYGGSDKQFQLQNRETLSTPATYQYFRLVVNETLGNSHNGTLAMEYLAFYGNFPNERIQTLPVSGTNMVTTTYTTQTTLTVPYTLPGVNISGLNLVITPTAVDSVIELKFNVFNEVHNDVVYRITRNINGTDVLVVPATNIAQGGINTHIYDEDHATTPQVTKIRWYDEPNTTSPVTYKLWINDTTDNTTQTNTLYLNRSGTTNYNAEYGVSTAAAIEHPKPQSVMSSVNNSTAVEGQVLETLMGKCDGSNITVSSGTYTMPSLPAHRSDGTNNVSTTTYTKDEASEITYKAPSGTERIKFEFTEQIAFQTSAWIMLYILCIDDVEIANTETIERGGEYATGAYTLSAIITSNETDLTQSHKYYFKLKHGETHPFKYAPLESEGPIWGLQSNAGLVPSLKITAIGTAQYDVVQRVVNYKDGQLLETLTGIFDGRSVTVASGTYTLKDVTAVQTVAGVSGGSFEDHVGTDINYKPPTGTRQVKITYTVATDVDGSLSHADGTHPRFRLVVDGTVFTSQQMLEQEADGYYNATHNRVFILDIGSVSSDDIANGKLASWNTSRHIKLQVGAEGYATSYNLTRKGVSPYGTLLLKPSIEIQAIGRALAPVGNFKIQDVDTITTPPTNGQALVWNATNLKWQAGNVASGGGGGSGPTNVMGQSFFEILTQQPHKFQADGAYTSSTSELTINWKYDSILLFHDSTVVAKLCFGANAQAKSLPFISQIKIQIRSPDTGNNWTDYETLTVSSSQDYNTTASLKTLTLPKFTGTPSGGIQTTLSKAGESNKFDIRVYGINNAENYPNEDTRALEYLQVFYLVPNPPSVPIWSSEVAIGSDASISFYYKCAETENIDPNNAGDQSDAFITSAITKYVEIETLAYNNAVSTTEYTDTESVSNKNENETFQITLSGLRAGTKYKYKVQAKNNLADNYSDFSAFRDHSAFTRTPGDNGIGTSVNFGINNSSRTSIRGYIDGTSTVSGSQIYINTAASQKVTPSTTSTQTIQITDPYSSTQHTTNTGYGNYVNGSTGLVTLKVTVDGTLKQTVSYGGFNTTPTDDSGSYTNFIDTIAQSDIYGTTNATKGFRLKGTFALNELSNTHITNTIGAARKTAHTLKYEYDRHADVGGSDASTTHNIYIDTLSGNPGITYTTSLVTVTSVKYTMGIASVDDMTINIVRTYTNCNSAHGFIKGDGHVGYIGAVSKTTYGAQYLTKSANNIDVSTPGSYTQSKSSSGINYTQAFTNGINNDLSETSYAYNLNGTTTGTAQSLKRGSATSNATLNHFHDHNSYANDTTANSKLTLSNLYEITAATISNFGSNMGAIATQAYTSHSTVPQAWTLLYINGGFRTNANFTYPNTSNINYDSVSVNTYSHGTTAYSTAGTSDSNGYKWYCQKFSMSASKSSHNVGGAITDYLNVYGIGGLSSSTMSKIKDAANLDAIGFVQQTVGGSSRIGNLGRAFKSTAVWYAQSGAVSWATQDTSATKANYGAVYEESSTKWGPILDTINGNDDIYIFIGLKNTVSLS